MIDLRIKMNDNDNNLCKEGMVIDYGEPQEYSDSMKSKFLILRVPDSWKAKAVDWVKGVDILNPKAAKHRKKSGIINFTTLKNSVGDPNLMPKLKNRALPIEPFNVSQFGIISTIIEDATTFEDLGPVLTGFSGLFQTIKVRAKNLVADFI